MEIVERVDQAIDFSDDLAVVDALRKAALVTRFSATYTLYVIAGALQSRSWARVREMVHEGMDISLPLADRYMMIASKIGFERLQQALEHGLNGGNMLTLDQWQALAATQDAERRDELMEAAIAHGLPAYEINAAAQDMSPQEYGQVRALRALNKALRLCEEYQVPRETVMDVLADFGYVQKVVRNVGR